MEKNDYLLNWTYQILTHLETAGTVRTRGLIHASRGGGLGKVLKSRVIVDMLGFGSDVHNFCWTLVMSTGI